MLIAEQRAQYLKEKAHSKSRRLVAVLQIVEDAFKNGRADEVVDLAEKALNDYFGQALEACYLDASHSETQIVKAICTGTTLDDADQLRVVFRNIASQSEFEIAPSNLGWLIID